MKLHRYRLGKVSQHAEYPLLSLYFHVILANFHQNHEENLNVFTAQKGSYCKEYFSENKLEISLFATHVEVSKWYRALSVEFL